MLQEMIRTRMKITYRMGIRVDFWDEGEIEG